MGGPGQGPSQARRWHLPPGAQGDAVLMAPAGDGSSALGLLGGSRLWGSDTRGMRLREEEQGWSSPKPDPMYFGSSSAFPPPPRPPRRQHRLRRQRRGQLRAARDTCFAQLSPKTSPSPILLCNSLPAGARASPAATSPSTLICSRSGHTLHKASSRHPGFPARAKGFFPAAGPAEARARPIPLCKLARGFASAGPAGDLYGWG